MSRRRQWVRQPSEGSSSSNAALSRRYTNLNKLSESIKAGPVNQMNPLKAFMTLNGPKLERQRNYTTYNARKPLFSGLQLTSGSADKQSRLRHADSDTHTGGSARLHQGSDSQTRLKEGGGGGSNGNEVSIAVPTQKPAG